MIKLSWFLYIRCCTKLACVLYRSRKWNEVYGLIVGIYPVLREYLNVILMVVINYCG